MTNTHWFDAASKRLTTQQMRRGVLHSAVALATASVLGGPNRMEADKKKHKKGKKGKKNGKGKRPTRKPKKPASRSCSDGGCAREFSSQVDRDWCEFICRQCDGDDPRHFCIIEGDPLDPAKIAVCCPEGAECCGHECCGSFANYSCCDGACTYILTDAKNCGGCEIQCDDDEMCIEGNCEHRCEAGGVSCPLDSSGCCPPDDDGDEYACCDDGCKRIRTSYNGGDRNNCGGCGIRCLEGQQCLAGGICGCAHGLTYCAPHCADTYSDPYNCGDCGNVCEPGKRCANGECRCEDGEQYCEVGQGCAPDSWVCCGLSSYLACHPTLPCCGSGAAAYCGQFGYCP